MNYQTEQEKFWATDFGNEYPSRNEGELLIASNIALFSKILRSAPTVKSVAELGCNIGLNLSALSRIHQKFDLRGYEINELAAKAATHEKIAEIVNTTITEPLASDKKFDLTFTKGVLIHINPDKLDTVYENLYNLSNRYIMVCEYYNPSPVAIEYRGHQDRLFKRDFAGELILKYNLKLLDYGFNYHRDPYFTNDDTTWFLLEK
jgi:pseudaminic acid biosynthesis-associated methylase